jgi:hypothetical protein
MEVNKMEKKSEKEKRKEVTRRQFLKDLGLFAVAGIALNKLDFLAGEIIKKTSGGSVQPLNWQCTQGYCDYGNNYVNCVRNYYCQTNVVCRDGFYCYPGLDFAYGCTTRKFSCTKQFTCSGYFNCTSGTFSCEEAPEKFTCSGVYTPEYHD